MPRRKQHAETISVRGFIRAQLHDAATGAVVGDSGWVENLITDTGFAHYICGCVGGVANSSQVNYICVAAQTAAPASGDDSLGTEQTRKAGSKSFVANGTLRSTASWATNEANTTLGTIALYATDTGGSMACATTFSSSAKTTDQTLSATYDLRFS